MATHASQQRERLLRSPSERNASAYERPDQDVGVGSNGLGEFEDIGRALSYGADPSLRRKHV
jgi:hypothetical protein